MALDLPSTQYSGRSGSPFPGNGASRLTPITSVKKPIGYTAAGTNSTQVLSINKSAGNAAVTNDDPSAVFIENTGMIPVIAMIGYESYTALVDGDVHYIHTLLHPGESIQAPVRGIIPLADQLHLTDETVLDFTAPNTNLYTDSTADVDAGKVCMVTFESNGTNSDYAINATVKYHIR